MNYKNCSECGQAYLTKKEICPECEERGEK